MSKIRAYIEAVVAADATLKSKYTTTYVMNTTHQFAWNVDVEYLLVATLLGAIVSNSYFYLN